MKVFRGHRILLESILGATALLFAAVAPAGVARAAETTLTLHDPGRSETTDPASALSLAHKRLAAHDAAAAIAGLVRYLSVYPQEAMVEQFLADLYFRAGQLATAESTYRDIIARDPYDTRAHARLGMLLLFEKRADAAIAELDAGLPESIDLLFAAHERKGDVAAFESAMQRRSNTRTSDADAQYEMAEVYDDLQLPYDALTFFKRALALYPASPSILNGLGVAQLQVHDSAAAEKTFLRCLRDDPDNYACTNDLGSLYLDRKRYDDARRELQRAHALAPEGPEALVNLGYLCDDTADRKQAVAYYVQAIYIWPYFTDAYVDLGFDQIREGAIDEAEGVLRKGLAVAPDDPRVHYLLGVVYEVRGRKTDAIAEFLRAESSSDPAIAQSARANVSDLQKSAVNPSADPN